MTLDQLRVFVTVARLQHVTQAARSLNKTQSAVSAAISALEQRHNVRLFDRVGRSITLTSDGQRFLPVALAVLEEADHAATVLTDIAGLPSGPLRVVASQTVATYWLPPRIARFHMDFPMVGLDLETLNTRGALDAVLEGRADIAIVEGRVTGAQFDTQVVGHDQLVVVVDKSHPWARPTPPTLDEIRSANWVFREEGSGTRETLSEELADRGVKVSSLRSLLVLPSNEACLAAVRSGQHVTAVSAFSARSQIDCGTLHLVDLEMHARNFATATHKQRYTTRALEEFQAYISDGADA